MSDNLRLFQLKGGKVYAIRVETLAEELGHFPDDRRNRVLLYELRPPELVGIFESEAEARRYLETNQEARPMR